MQQPRHLLAANYRLGTRALRVVPSVACAASSSLALRHRSDTRAGEPKPEDDPLNYDGEKRVRGPSDSDIQARRTEQAKDSPWSNPERAPSLSLCCYVVTSLFT